MAKRLTDTEKWKKGFVRSLSPENKLLWIYLIDNCDHAGIWEYYPDMAELQIGWKYDWELVVKTFSDKIIIVEDKWFIPSFIQFQYGELNPKNRAHLSVINRLKSLSLFSDDKGLNKPLTSPLQGDKDKDKDNISTIGLSTEESVKKKKAFGPAERALQEIRMNGAYEKIASNQNELFQLFAKRVIEDPEWWKSTKDFCRIHDLTRLEIEDSIKAWAGHVIRKSVGDLGNYAKAEASLQTWLINERKRRQEA